MKYLGAALTLICVLSHAKLVHAGAFASATAGNAESPTGNDFQMGLDSAVAATSDTDPNFGTATAEATVSGPSLSTSGFAASFVGPAWIANGSGEWLDNLEFRFPVESVTGLPENLEVELVASFIWDIQDNGGYNFDIQSLGASYSTADGLGFSDFPEIADSPAGSAVIAVMGSFNSVMVDPENPTFYLAEFAITMSLSGGAGSGDWQHGSFPTASGTFSLALTDIILHDGEGEIEDPEIESDSGESYEFEIVTADFDDDGDVDGRDFLLWQRGYGIETGAELIDGDSNADGDVDGDDLGVWQDQYAEPGHLVNVASVPEPGGTALWCIALAIIIRYKRRS